MRITPRPVTVVTRRLKKAKRPPNYAGYHEEQSEGSFFARSSIFHFLFVFRRSSSPRRSTIAVDCKSFRFPPMLIDFLFVGVHRHLPFFPVSQILFVFVFFLPTPMTICISSAFHRKMNRTELITNLLCSVLDANHPFDSNSTVAVLKIKSFSSFFSGVSLSMHLIRYVRWKKTVSSLGICSCGFFFFLFLPLLSLLSLFLWFSLIILIFVCSSSLTFVYWELWKKTRPKKQNRFIRCEWRDFLRFVGLSFFIQHLYKRNAKNNKNKIFLIRDRSGTVDLRSLFTADYRDRRGKIDVRNDKNRCKVSRSNRNFHQRRDKTKIEVEGFSTVRERKFFEFTLNWKSTPFSIRDFAKRAECLKCTASLKNFFVHSSSFYVSNSLPSAVPWTNAKLLLWNFHSPG